MSPHGVSVNLSELPAPRSDHSRMAFLSEYPDDEQALVRIVSPYEGLEVSLRWNARTFPYASYWMEAGIARVISGGASFGVTVLLRCHWSCRFNVWLGRANGWHRHRRPGVGDERRGLGDRELGVHPGGVVVGEVADKFILPGRQGDGYPA